MEASLTNLTEPLREVGDSCTPTADTSSEAPVKETHAAWADQFSKSMRNPSEQEIEFFRERRRQNVGVGLNADGDLIYQTLDHVR